MRTVFVDRLYPMLSRLGRHLQSHRICQTAYRVLYTNRVVPNSTTFVARKSDDFRERRVDLCEGYPPTGRNPPKRGGRESGQIR